MNPVHNTLTIQVCNDANDAIQRGFVYPHPEYKPIRIKQVVVIEHGTDAGKATVDFVLEDETGQKFMFMITHQLLKNIPG